MGWIFFSKENPLTWINNVSAASFRRSFFLFQLFNFFPPTLPLTTRCVYAMNSLQREQQKFEWKKLAQITIILFTYSLSLLIGGKCFIRKKMEKNVMVFFVLTLQLTFHSRWSEECAQISQFSFISLYTSHIYSSFKLSSAFAFITYQKERKKNNFITFTTTILWQFNSFNIISLLLMHLF